MPSSRSWRTSGPSSAVDTFQGPVEDITANRETGGVLFFVGLAGAVYSASGYVGAFARACNVIYEVEEGGRTGSCGRSSWA